MLSFNLFSKTMHFVKEKRPLSFVIPKKLHLKLVCMKRFYCRDEARSSLKNVKRGNFVFQQETFLSHLSHWWKALLENLVVKVMIFNNVSFFSQQEKQPVCRERNYPFSPLSTFLPIIMVPEYAVGGLVGQTRITNDKNYKQLILLA